MLSSAGETIPNRVALRLEAAETVLATLHGRLESGFALTERRLFAWRANGTGGPIPLSAVDRILVDSGPGGDHIDLVVLPRQALHQPLVLTRRASELVSTLAFVAQLAAAVGREPVTEELGPIHRFSFPRPVAVAS
jgi:hypothetical protein